jgi:hypothetical protein
MSTKVSRPVLRGPGPSNGAWLLGCSSTLPLSVSGSTLTRAQDEDALTEQWLNLRVSVAEALLGSGGLSGQLYGRRYHKQHGLRFFRGF